VICRIEAASSLRAAVVSDSAVNIQDIMRTHVKDIFGSSQGRGADALIAGSKCFRLVANQSRQPLKFGRHSNLSLC
jgi:UDP-N-acetylglucosamine enolpyruvyl transferase